MKKLTPIVSALVLALSLGCGGGEDGDTVDGGNGADANLTPDAGTAITGFGEVCDRANPMCPAAAPTCVSTNAMATQGFCTITCGTTPQNVTTPPADGTAMCLAAYTGTVPAQGSPGCVLSAAPMMGTITWACGIACGDLMGTDFGGCPAPLTCQANLCEP